MASIRRTLSPAHHDRANHNGASVLPLSSPSSKLFPYDKYSSPAPAAFGNFAARVWRFAAGAFSQRHSRKGWRRSSYRYLIFFFLGFLVGMMPFGQVDDIRSKGFSFEIKPQHVNAQLEENDADRGVMREDLFVDLVSLGAEKESRVKEMFDFVPRKQLIVVTPTYNRALQAYFLNRMAQVLRLVPPPLLWIVVEMNPASVETAEVLRKTGVMYRHLVCAKNLTNVKDRGVHQRNTALEHIEHHRLDGIVYFADDDNIYSLDLFESLRGISCFGTWPVAMLAQSKNKAILEGPVCNGSQVIGWHTNEKSKRLRRFHVDMSGFAFNSTMLWDPKRWKRRPTSALIRQLDSVKEGFQETTFIEQVMEDESEMEGTPVGCSRVMNWHLHLESQNIFYPGGWVLQKNLDAIVPIK